MSDVFTEVADFLFGDGADALIRKMDPDGADLSTPGGSAKRRKTAYRASMAANTVAVVGGTHALALTAEKFKVPPKGAGKHMGEVEVGRAAGALRKLPGAKTVARHPALAAAGVGTAWLGLHGIELSSDLAGRHAMKNQYKQSLSKSESCVGGGLKRGSLKRLPEKVKKSTEIDVKWEGEFSKVNADKQQVFGWASIVEMNGEPVVDLQGDYISIDEVEKSAYEYVQKSRKGGDMHLRDETGNPVHASEMIESFIVTPEKKAALNMPDDTPTGWWVGFKIHDENVWEKVKSGERTGFSIHGVGQRSPMEDFPVR